MIVVNLECVVMDSKRDLLRLALRYSVTAAGQIITIASLLDLSDFAELVCDFLLAASLGKRTCADRIESCPELMYLLTPDQHLDMLAIRSALDSVVR
jgi:hypothetical protein